MSNKALVVIDIQNAIRQLFRQIGLITVKRTDFYPHII